MGYPALISVSCLIQSEKSKLNPPHISHKNQFHIKVIKSVILRLEGVYCLDIRSGIIKEKWKMLLLSIKFLYERNCKILSKVKTNNKERIFVICGGGFCFCFCFYVFCFLQIHLYLFFTSLYLGGVQPSHRFCAQWPLQEFDTNFTTVAMGPSSPDHLSPDHSGFVWFASKTHCVVFGFV